jgi:hypothetical protein
MPLRGSDIARSLGLRPSAADDVCLEIVSMNVPELGKAADADLPGARRPQGASVLAGDLVAVNFAIRSVPSRSILETSWATIDGRDVGGVGEPCEFHVFDSGAPLGLSLCAGALRVGGRGVFRTASLPVLTDSLLNRPRAGEDLEFEVELLSAQRALPPVPAREELQEESRRRELAERDAFLEAAPAPWSDRVREAEEMRARAESLRRDGAVEDAEDMLGRAFAILFYSSEEAKWSPATREEEALVLRQRGMLHSDRSACKMSRGEWAGAAWDARKAMDALGSDRISMLRLGACRVRWVARREGDAELRVTSLASGMELAVRAHLLDHPSDSACDAVLGALGEVLLLVPGLAGSGRVELDDLGRMRDDPLALQRLRLVGSRGVWRAPLALNGGAKAVWGVALGCVRGLLGELEEMRERRARMFGGKLNSAGSSASEAAVVVDDDDDDWSDLPPLE